MSCLSGYEYDATRNKCNFIEIVAAGSDLTYVVIGMVVGTVVIFMICGLGAFLYFQYKESPT